jgi:MFS family permease
MTRAERLTLLAAIVGTSVVMLDGSIVNVALPAIARDLGGGLASQQWVANSYLLLLGSFILVGGSLGDIYGERKVFGLGVSAFGLCSLGCAIAPNVGTLIAARALQGIAGAMVTPSSLAIIVAAFPPERRGGAIGAWTAWTGIGVVAGPLIGGWIVDTASWRWVFAINVRSPMRLRSPTAASTSSVPVCARSGWAASWPRSSSSRIVAGAVPSSSPCSPAGSRCSRPLWSTNGAQRIRW